MELMVALWLIADSSRSLAEEVCWRNGVNVLVDDVNPDFDAAQSAVPLAAASSSSRVLIREESAVVKWMGDVLLRVG